MVDGKVLYENSEIKISFSPKYSECHDVYITQTDNTHLLQKGILEDVIKSEDHGKGTRKLFNSNPTLTKESSNVGIRLMFCLASAYIAQVEQERDHWLGEYNEVKRQRDESACALDHATGPNRDVKGIMG